jgi:diguanylate cyclase (GGDEF)-like protein/PAS domain S-box-containing protein
MRLRNWIAVVVSVILLIGVGVVGLLVNRSALRAADTVHRADSRALGVNNGTLAGQLQMLSAAELKTFVTDHKLTLTRGDTADRAALRAFAGKTSVFQYGVVLTDLKGTVLNSTRSTGLPPVTDPGYQPMRALLAAGRPGFSSMMTVGQVAVQAVAVPILRSGAPVAIVVGFNQVARSQMQAYVGKLSDAKHLTTIVDGTGRVAATSDPGRLGTLVDPAIVRAATSTTSATFVRYHAGRTPMIAVVVPGLPGGWAYVRSQTVASFDGAVHSRSQSITLTLLAMLLIGIVGITLLGYRTQVQRRRADERFQALFQHAPDMVSVLDVTGRIQYSSPSAAAVVGAEVGALTGASVFDLVHPDDRERMREAFRELMAERDAVLRLQTRVLHTDGGFRWFEFTASNQTRNPSLNGVVINARDVSENRAFQERLAHEAQHDALTGLPNRRRMQDALGSSLRTGSVAVLFVDLDGFKPVNDVYGHETGDELLRQVASRLSACVREEDVLSRVGGDEFVVLMPGVMTPTDAEAMSARVREAVERPFLIAGHEVTIGASVGVHLADTTDDPDQALRAADHAMYAVKRAGGGRRRPASSAHTVIRRAGRHRAEA